MYLGANRMRGAQRVLDDMGIATARLGRQGGGRDLLVLGALIGQTLRVAFDCLARGDRVKIVFIRDTGIANQSRCRVQRAGLDRGLPRVRPGGLEGSTGFSSDISRGCTTACAVARCCAAAGRAAWRGG